MDPARRRSRAPRLRCSARSARTWRRSWPGRKDRLWSLGYTHQFALRPQVFQLPGAFHDKTRMTYRDAAPERVAPLDHVVRGGTIGNCPHARPTVARNSRPPPRMRSCSAKCSNSGAARSPGATAGTSCTRRAFAPARHRQERDSRDACFHEAPAAQGTAGICTRKSVYCIYSVRQNAPPGAAVEGIAPK